VRTNVTSRSAKWAHLRGPTHNQPQRRVPPLFIAVVTDSSTISRQRKNTTPQRARLGSFGSSYFCRRIVKETYVRTNSTSTTSAGMYVQFEFRQCCTYVRRKYKYKYSYSKVIQNQDIFSLRKIEGPSLPHHGDVLSPVAFYFWLRPCQSRYSTYSTGCSSSLTTKREKIFY
jgi:hypothetical protein